MRPNLASPVCLVVGLVVLGVGSASAQEGQSLSIDYDAVFDPEQFTPTTDPESIGPVDGAVTQTRGSLAVGLAFHLIGPELGICVNDGSPTQACTKEGDILASRLRADLGALYGFGRFDVRLSLPLVLHQSTDFGPAMGESALGSAGVGNPKVGVRYQLARPGPLNLAADLAVAIPTGGRDFIGDRGLIVDPRFLVDLRSDQVGLGVGLGYRYRQSSARIADLYVDDELTWSVAAHVWVAPRKVVLGVGAYGRVGIMNAPVDPMALDDTPPSIGPEERPAEVLGSTRWFVTPRLAVEAGAGTALSSGYGAAPFRVLAGVRWIDRKPEAPAEPRKPRRRDQDRDGVDDLHDRCAATPEDADGFEDADGCPELDNDGDGIDDKNDRCPLAAEDMDGFEDGDGCPEADNDRDGVDDGADKCPTTAEDRDGVADDDGCPETDGDGDGVDDGADKCPLAEEDKDGIADDDGCPESDADQDGLSDQDDKCPTEAEVFNDSDDDDGCPDAGRTLAFVEGDAVVITEKIFFDLNRARIKTRSQPVLNAVAAILKAHGDLRVSIEGHTDDQGTADWNRELSRLRSERVREYLIKKGIAADRLETKGFGSDRPLVQGVSEAARDQNRRVEFVIIGRMPEGEATP